MMEKHSKNWYAVITADVLFDKRLTDKQKLLTAVIANLSNEKGYCFASNAYLAELLDCSIRTIQRELAGLEELKYLGRVVKLKPDGEVEYRALTPMSRPMTNATVPHVTNVTPPHDADVIYNNKEINNKEENILKVGQPDPAKPGDRFRKFIEWFNEHTPVNGKPRKFKPTKIVKAKFEARLKEGYGGDELARAVRNAYNSQHHRETNHKYLTPEFILRPDKLEMFVNAETTNPKLNYAG